jgi:hypothetical protein
LLKYYQEDENMGKDKVEKTNDLLSNSMIGTTLFAIIYLQKKEGYAKYDAIFKKVFPNEDKRNNAKLSYYLDILKGPITISYIDYNGKEVPPKKIQNIITPRGGGIYKYNKDKVEELFIESLKASSADFTSEEYDKGDFFDSEEIKQKIFDYVENYTSSEKCWEDDTNLYSIWDILDNLETHLIVQYYNNELTKYPSLFKWAKLLIDDEKKVNLFHKKK